MQLVHDRLTEGGRLTTGGGTMGAVADATAPDSTVVALGSPEADSVDTPAASQGRRPAEIAALLY